MKIQNLEIKNFIPFSFSRIKSIALKELDDIFLIQISSLNGSGKTTFLNEISPWAAIRSRYTPEGYKSITLSHQNSIYVLKYNALSNHPYSFIKDKIELNPTGSFSIQNELVYSEFNLTKLKYDVLKNQIKMSQLTSAQRKDIVLKLSPYNLNLILDLHKKINKSLKDKKANLTHLKTREFSLKNEMISDVEYADLKEKRHTNLFYLEETLKHLNILEEKYNTFTLEDLDMSLDDIISSLNEIKTLGLHKPHCDEHSLNKYIFSLEALLSSKESEIKDILSRINDLNIKLESIEQTKEKNQFLKDIKKIKQDIKILSKNKTSILIKESELEDFEVDLEFIDEFTTEALNTELKFISLDKLNRRRIYVSKAENKVFYLNRLLEDLKTKHNEVQFKIKITPDKIPQDNCAKTGCPLYNTYMESYTNLQNTLKAYKKEIYKTNRLLTRYNTYLKHVHSYMTQFSFYESHYTKFLNLCTKYNFISSVFKQNLLIVLNNNPKTIYTKLKHILEVNKDLYTIKTLEKDLQEKLKDIEKIKSFNINELKFIKTQIKKENDILTERTREFERYTRQLKYYNNTISDLNKYEGVLKHLSSLEDKLKSYYYYNIKLYTKNYIKELIDILQKNKEVFLSKISDYDRQLKHQEYTYKIYNDEILSQIEIIEESKSKYEKVEKALSPKRGISHVYTLHFLNLLIEKVNFYISLVFTYRLEIYPLDVESDVDYSKLKCHVEDNDIRDISELSESQKEMIDTGFNLAFIDICQLNDYPLFLDEFGASFDVTHRAQISNLIYHLVGKISGLFLVSHDVGVSDGLVEDSLTLVLNDSNIILPARYNDEQHIDIRKK